MLTSHSALFVGEVSGPIGHNEIDCHKATSTYGYGKPFNTTGIPIVGMNFIEAKNNDPSKGAKFKCGTCEAEFGFLDRLAHLTSVKHRRFYLVGFFEIWKEISLTCCCNLNLDSSIIVLFRSLNNT